MPGTVVMGVIFVDIKGFPFGEYHATGTNLGSIRFVHGGVARNVAEDMARIGSPVTFVTLGDTTPMSREAMERLEAQKIDLRYSIRVPQNGVGLWLAVMDEKGDLAGSTSQMPDTEPLARYLQERGEEIVSGADSVCLEMDMGEELSEWIVALCQKYRKDLYCISANMSVVQRRPDLLRHTRCFICNDIEAERLLHHPVSRADPEAAVETILHYGRGMGLRSMVVTLGSSGSVTTIASPAMPGTAPPTGWRWWIPPVPEMPSSPVLSRGSPAGFPWAGPWPQAPVSPPSPSKAMRPAAPRCRIFGRRCAHEENAPCRRPPPVRWPGHRHAGVRRAVHPVQ